MVEESRGNDRLIDQVLHGYDDGHRLLASSVNLDSEDRRLLARQTDSPDAGRVSGWEALLTGFVLPSRSFAISMTWPAWEMPRPGCVWTHSLILDLSSIDDLTSEAILKLFRQPQIETVETYRDPLVLSMSESHGVTDYEQLSTLIWAFYETPMRRVRAGRIQVRDQGRHQIQLKTWLLGWREVRATTSFCDAPRTPRTIYGRPFDLQLHQIVPDDSQGDRVLRGIPKTPPPRWVKRLVSESQTNSGLRTFLSTFGPPSTDRGLMRPLVSIYIEHESEKLTLQNCKNVVEILARAFPTFDSGSLIKNVILHPKGVPPAGCPRALPEAQILAALVAIDLNDIFDETELEITARARHLAESDREAFRFVLAALTESETKIADAFLSGATETLDVEILKDLHGISGSLAMRALNLSPELLHAPATWSLIDSSILWRASVNQRGKRQRVDTISAILLSEADLDPRIVFEAWPDGPIRTLEALGHQDVTLEKAASWLKEISSQEVLRYVNEGKSLGPEALSVVMESLSPDEIARLPLALVERASVVASQDARCAVLAAGIVRPDDSRWAQISLELYALLYDAIVQDRLANRKRIFEAVSPELPEWDLRKRLARAFKYALSEGRWDPLAALTLTHKEAFRSIFEVDENAILAQTIIKEASLKGVSILPWQRKTLSQSIVESSDLTTAESMKKFLSQKYRKLLKARKHESDESVS